MKTLITANSSKTAITYKEYVKMHPDSKKTPDDPMFSEEQQGKPTEAPSAPQQSAPAPHAEPQQAQTAPQPEQEEQHDDEENEEDYGDEPEVEDENPRLGADKETHEELNDPKEYAFARGSKFSNLGKDIVDSARHVRNAWKSLEQAEADGTAENMVNRESLFKNEPPDILSKVDESNYETALLVHGALKRFPAEPELPRYYANKKNEEIIKWNNQDTSIGDFKKRLRKEYYDTYKGFVAKAEGLVAQNKPPQEALNELREFVKHHVQSLRHADRSSPTGNLLVPLVNTVLNSYVSPYKLRSKSPPRSAAADLALFKHLANPGQQPASLDPHTPLPNWMPSQQQNEQPAEPQAPHDSKGLAEKVRDFIEGASLNKIFKVQSNRRKRFSAADAYVKHATRVGPEVPYKTKEEQEAFLMNNAKMYGIQWGNSVTDAEREHHLKMVTESFSDLAEILQLPTEICSYDGNLGLAIGARGKGSALAHYEPDLRVINLTRKKGVGSLAHEHLHFLDNMIGKAVTNGASYMSDFAAGFRQVPPEHQEITMAMKELTTKIQQGFYKRMREEPVWRSLMPAERQYWGSTKEMLARCFEKYVQHKLKKQNRENTYLSGVLPHPLWANDQETEELAPLFDKFFDTFRNSNMLVKKVAMLMRIATLEARLK